MKRIFLFFLFFHLIVSVTGGTGAAAEKEKKWQFGDYKKADGRSGAWSTAEDGRTRLDIGCNIRLGRTVAGSLDDYTGNALKRIDGEADPVIFEIMDANGKVSSFGGKFGYYAPDKAWGYGNYPLGLLDAFGQGEKLTLRNGKGVIIAQFNLKGAAQARASMRDICGF